MMQEASQPRSYQQRMVEKKLLLKYCSEVLCKFHEFDQIEKLTGLLMKFSCMSLVHSTNWYLLLVFLI